jgi:hypothetical protein
MAEQKENETPPMPEPIALALAIAGLYGEALRAQERGDVSNAARCLDAYERLGALNAERGAPRVTQTLCAAMLGEHERRVMERQ